MAISDYEEALTSYIQDDDKLVTYKWLSKEFEIHVNVAKDVLKQYWKKYRGNKNIVASFLLIGQLKDRSIRVEVVKESNLNDAKDKFINVDCEHLYSLQNQNSLEDLELLAFMGEGDVCYSAIKCNTKYVRNDEKMHSLRYIENINKEESNFIESNEIANKVLGKQMLKEIVFFSNTKLKNVIKENDVRKQEKIDKNGKIISESGTKEIIVSEKRVSPIKLNINSKSFKSNIKVEKIQIESRKSGFNNLFTKGLNETQIFNKMKDFDSNEQKSLSYASNPEMEIYKGKYAKSLVEKEKKENKRNETKNIIQKEENVNLETKHKNIILKQDNKDNDEKKSKNNKDAKEKKQSHNQESNISLKRKRIIVMDSSEDESSNIDDKETKNSEQFENEKQIPNVKKSSISSTKKHKNMIHMVKRTIDETFKDEDGYFVTKRVHIYEVADNDEYVENKVKEPSKLKLMEMKAKKQTTLMNFFKKS